MSLLIWVPFIDDLQSNFGSANVSVQDLTLGTVKNTSGKIGNCREFTGSSYFKIRRPVNLTSIKNSSICAWVKCTGSVMALGGISNDTNYSDPIMTLYTSGWQFSGSSAYKYLNGGVIVNTSDWHHYCCTCDNTTITTYLDGIKVASSTLIDLGVVKTELTSNNFIEIGCDHPGGDEYLTGCINDFRVYNHCLIPFEVKQIAQGLVGHYTFSRRGTENLLRGTAMTHAERAKNPLSANDGVFTNCFRYYNGSASNHSFSGNIDTITLSSGTNIGISFLRKATDINLDSSSFYTLSCEAQCSAEGAHLDIGLSYYNTNNTWVWRGGSNPQNFNATNKWQKFTFTFKPDADTQYIDYCFTINNTGTFKIKNCKMEKGSVATDWMPNKEDIAYKQLGYESKIEPDSSGFGYHGLQNNIPIYVNDTARYTTSAYFDGTNTKGLKIPLEVMLGNGSITDWTFSCWFKKEKAATGWESILGGPSFELDIGHSTYKNHIYLYSWGGSTYEYTLNKWHHLVFVRTSSNSKAYLDGNLILTGTAGKTPTSGNNYYIGAYSSSGTSQCMNANISDVRIYATPLSESDIKELYNSYCHIGGNGILFPYTIKEEFN